MAIVIDVSLRARGVETGLKRLDTALDKVLGKVVQLRKEWEALNNAMGSSASAMGSAARSLKVAQSRGGGAGGGKAPLAPPNSFSKITSSQHAQQAKAFVNHVRSLGGNASPTQLRHHNQAVRGLSAFQNANDPMAKYVKAFMRTRFAQGAGGKLMGHVLGADLLSLGPLAGQLLGSGGGLSGLAGAAGAAGGGGAAAAVGAEALALLTNPITAVVAAMAAGVAALVASINRARAAFESFSKLQVAYGTGGAASAAGINAFAPGALPGARSGLSGFAASVGASIGLSPMTGPLGDMDYLGRARKIYYGLRGAKSERAFRTITETIPGAADLAPYARNLSDGQSARFLRGPMGGASPFSAAAGRAITQFDFEHGQLGQNLNSVWTKVGSTLAEDILPTLTKVLKAVNEWFDKHGKAVMKGIEVILSPIAKVMALLESLLDRIPGLKTDAAERTAKATEQMAKDIQTIRDGNYGGGHRVGTIKMHGWGPGNYLGGDMRNAGQSLI